MGQMYIYLLLCSLQRRCCVLSAAHLPPHGKTTVFCTIQFKYFRFVDLWLPQINRKRKKNVLSMLFAVRFGLVLSGVRSAKVECNSNGNIC